MRKNNSINSRRKSFSANSRPERGTKDGEKFLIVTEGQKTEVNYLTDFAREYNIRSRVHILKRGSASDPTSVFNAAEKENGKQKNDDGSPESGHGYAKIFCVFDRDSHDDKNFKEAQQKMKGKKFIKILSTPCIEYWFLLHFEYSRKAYEKSIDCKNELKKHIKGYTENMTGLCSGLQKNLSKAKKNAITAMKDAKATANPNPSTEVHLLIEELEKLSRNN